MMKVLNNIEIIIISSEVYYNYNGTLYTKEQFEDTYFPKVDTSSKPQEEIEDLFDVEGNICVKLKVNDYVKFSFDNGYDQLFCSEGIIVDTEYDNNDRISDYYKVKTCNDSCEVIGIYGRDIDRAWR